MFHLTAIYDPSIETRFFVTTIQSVSFNVDLIRRRIITNDADLKVYAGNRTINTKHIKIRRTLETTFVNCLCVM